MFEKFNSVYSRRHPAVKPDFTYEEMLETPSHLLLKRKTSISPSPDGRHHAPYIVRPCTCSTFFAKNLGTHIALGRIRLQPMHLEMIEHKLSRSLGYTLSSKSPKHKNHSSSTGYSAMECMAWSPPGQPCRNTIYGDQIRKRTDGCSHHTSSRCSCSLKVGTSSFSNTPNRLGRTPYLSNVMQVQRIYVMQNK